MQLKIQYFLIVFFLVFGQNILAQNEANVWYFGGNAGLDFNNDTVQVLTNGQTNTHEGCATISSPNGDLLFYTDGITVWDKTHEIMPNGTGLMGDSSSTQSGIIVPKPNDFDKYYVFTVAKEGGPNGLRYSEVDLTLNNGNGNVTGTKNVLLNSPTAEKITAIKHANGRDFWVISHSWNSANFIAYLVSPSGITTTPVTSNVGAIHGNGSIVKSIGYLKISPDTTKLALAIYGNGTTVELFDFDNATGTVSNPITLDNSLFTNSGGGTYGVEFSPDSSVLYVSDLSYVLGESSVYQFDLSNYNAASIAASQHTLYNGSDFIGAIQLAVNGKLYLANESTEFLDVISNPNVLGTGANYLNREIDLVGGASFLGLPQFIQSFFNISFNAINTCLGNETEFFLNASDSINSVLWDFGDGNTSTNISPLHTYLTAGNYTVTVTVNSNNGSQSLSQNITIYNNPIANAVNNFSVCVDSSNQTETFDLSTKTNAILGSQSSTTFGVSYFLSEEDAITRTNQLQESYQNTENPQQIFAKIYNLENNECYDITTFNLIVNTQPIANPIEDVVLCDGEVNDNTEAVYLNTFNPTILLSQDQTVFSISYHLNNNDAQTGLNPLPNYYQAQTNAQTIFVRIVNNANLNCYATTSFSIKVEGQLVANQPNNFYLCDPENDGIESFDLTLLNNEIIGSQTGSYAINYYLTPTDANLSTNPLVLPYTNQALTQTIYAKIERNNNTYCNAITSFEIGVLNTPLLELEPIYYLCLNESITIEANLEYDSYQWSNGETTPTITLTQAGNYSLTVTNNYATNPNTSCSETKNFTVITSGEAEIDTIEISDWTANNNTLTIIANGIGDYEYSIDSVNYQDSNMFTNLGVGEYAVFVRDKNNCGVVTKKAYLLYYPKYFTPNGDEHHPYWQIYASASEPDLTILIFDRYGKFITKLNPLGAGWDGTYNGKNMPSSDYWFVVKRPNNEQIYKGHFSLIR